jgi:hypothetical protein
MGRFLAGFEDELVKTSARAGLKLIRRLIQGGDVAKAERLALTPGVIKKTRAGSEIKDLGRGMEGVSTLVAHPKKGIAVRKIYDPQGVSKPKMIQRKEELARALPSPSLPAFYGSAKAKGGHTMHFSEFVPGQTEQAMRKGGIKAMTDTSLPAKERLATYTKKMEGINQMNAQRKRLMGQAERKGFTLSDVHDENVMGVTRPGSRLTQMKAVDALPRKHGDRARDLLHEERLPMMRGGTPDPYYQNRAAGADLKQQAFRGTAPRHKLGPAPPPPRWMTPASNVTGGPPPITMPPGTGGSTSVKDFVAQANQRLAQRRAQIAARQPGPPAIGSPNPHTALTAPGGG